MTLISTDNQDGREKDTDEQVFFRQKQSKEDSDTNPEQDKADGFFHKNDRPVFIKSAYFYYMQGNGKKFISFLPDIGYNSL